MCGHRSGCWARATLSTKRDHSLLSGRGNRIHGRSSRMPALVERRTLPSEVFLDGWRHAQRAQVTGGHRQAFQANSSTFIGRSWVLGNAFGNHCSSDRDAGIEFVGAQRGCLCRAPTRGRRIQNVVCLAMEYQACSSERGFAWATGRGTASGCLAREIELGIPMVNNRDYRRVRGSSRLFRGTSRGWSGRAVVRARTSRELCLGCVSWQAPFLWTELSTLNPLQSRPKRPRLVASPLFLCCIPVPMVFISHVARFRLALSRAARRTSRCLACSLLSHWLLPRPMLGSSYSRMLKVMWAEGSNPFITSPGLALVAQTGRRRSSPWPY